jgi:hypothetical protein
MIVKNVNNNNCLDRVKTNQIDIVRENVRPVRTNVFSLFLILFISIVFAFALISLSSESVVAVPGINTEEHKASAPYTQKLYGTQGSGRVLWEQNIATAAGVGRIPDDSAQGKLLGRRGALTDARRNLLILRQKLLNDDRFSEKDIKRYKISGKIAGVVIHSERIKNNLYFLQVDIPLDKLMEGEVEIDIE